jgi:diguanylate cyclase (GGDEF)-like protein
VRYGAQDYLIKGEQNNKRLANTLLYAIERRRSEEKLRYLAHHDYLTGLVNRTLFQDRLAHMIIRAKRYGQRFALVFLDLDGLKNINDTLGHDVGDELLKMAAQRLRSCVRTSDTLARLGGDEFTALLENIGDDQVCADIAKNILTVTRQPYLLAEQEVEVTWSIGIAIYPQDGSDTSTLLRNADQAMYRAKQQGRNRYFFYSQES